MNENNLRALAKFLRELADPAHFNMGTFLANSDGQALYLASATRKQYSECGTIACAVGHAVFLFPTEEGENWLSYCDRVFGISSSTREWDFLFSSNWVSADNTPLGASKRIDYLLGHGCPTMSEIRNMWNKDTPLCYA